jgi:hypothetical protein
MPHSQALFCVPHEYAKVERTIMIIVICDTLRAFAMCKNNLKLDRQLPLTVIEINTSPAASTLGDELKSFCIDNRHPCSALVGPGATMSG